MDSNKRLYRSNDTVIAGVCGGIAEYLEFDPTIIRTLTVFLVLAGAGLPIIAYIIAMIVMPKSSDDYTGYIDVEPSAAKTHSSSSGTVSGATPCATTTTVAARQHEESAVSAHSAHEMRMADNASIADVAAAGVVGVAAVGTSAAAVAANAGAARAAVVAATSQSSWTAPVTAASGVTAAGFGGGQAEQFGGEEAEQASQTSSTTTANSSPRSSQVDQTHSQVYAPPSTQPNYAAAQPSQRASAYSPPGSAYTASNPQAYDAASPANNEKGKQRTRGIIQTGLVLGVLFVGLGVLALAGIFYGKSVFDYWPALIILLGFLILCTPGYKGWSLARVGNGLSTIVVGFVLLLWTLDVIAFSTFFSLIRYLWPVVFIIIGLSIIGAATKQSVFKLLGSLLFCAALIMGVWHWGIAQNSEREVDNAVDIATITIPGGGKFSITLPSLGINTPDISTPHDKID